MTTSTRSQVIMAHIFCVAQQFTSVTTYVLGKKILGSMDVYHFIFARILFVIPIVFVAAWLMTRKLQSFKVPWKMFGLMAASGVVGIFIAQSLVFVGLDKSTATNTSIISAPCTPLFTALFSVLRGSDKMNIPKGFGFLTSIVGTLLLLQVWNFEFKGKTLGNLLIVGCSICSAFNSLLQKHILNAGYHPLVTQFYVCCVGMLSYICGYTWFGLLSFDSWAAISGRVWVYVVIVGIVASALPWCVSIIALKHTSPLTASVYVVLQPLIAGFVGVLLLGEVLTWIQLIGGALVISGLVLVNAQPIVQRLFFRNTKVEFELLPTEEETKEIELQVIAEASKDGADVKPTEEVKYDLAPKEETNSFVADGADFKPADEAEVFTPEFVRLRHEHEEAEGYNFSVTLHKPALTSEVFFDKSALTTADEAAYKLSHSQDDVAADYVFAKDGHGVGYFPASCKEKSLSEPPTPTLRPIV